MANDATDRLEFIAENQEDFGNHRAKLTLFFNNLQRTMTVTCQNPAAVDSPLVTNVGDVVIHSKLPAAISRCRVQEINYKKGYVVIKLYKNVAAWWGDKWEQSTQVT